uniref:Uncharacterized protein n=1 Tax=Oryza brachyantha TaxID=4533 RepID=J3LH00_ORYBR
RLPRLPRLLRPLRRPAGLRQVIHGPRRPRRAAALQPAAATRRRRPGVTSRSPPVVSPDQTRRKGKRASKGLQEDGALSSIASAAMAMGVLVSEIDRRFSFPCHLLFFRLSSSLYKTKHRFVAFVVALSYCRHGFVDRATVLSRMN